VIRRVPNIPGFITSSVLRRHKLRNYAGAAEAFAMWVKQKGKTLQGLIRRRAAEAKLYRGRSVMRLVKYLERRLGERSFWSDVIAAFVAAAALPKPWAYYVAGAALMKALVPDAVTPAK
jgi:hypothetical protein